MVKSLKERLNDVLIKSGLLTEEKLKRAIQLQKERCESISAILIEEGLISQTDLMALLSQELNIPPINLSKYKIDPEIGRIIPERIARHYRLIPISKIGNILMVAMSNPLDIFAIDDIKALTNYEIDLVLSTDKDILDAINACYSTTTDQMLKVLEEVKEITEPLELVEVEKVDIREITEESNTAPIVRMVNLILTEALKKRASDIHIEPCESDLRIRYRIDGNLQEALSLPKKNQNAILARLKIMSKLDITESRLPQDGRFKIRLNEKEIDFRVSVLPITFGGKIVLRALDKSNLSIGLDKLGFSPGSLKAFKEAIAKPYGMMLVTGPTGSGKSTTLYSVLNQLSTPDRNIVTIEDPVEYQVEGITQVQANPEIGLTFANGLRSILRQSPDVIMIGEIRDQETADIAIKSALIGQLVLSTLHTNDAAGAITRLIDMGIEPFLIASSVIMVAAQRLYRRICPKCKEPYSIPKSILEKEGLNFSKETVFYHGRGCRHCNQTGYYGRMGVLEVMSIDDNIRELIIKHASSDKIKQYATNHGMKTLRDNALEEFISGMTTFEEVLRITSEE